MVLKNIKELVKTWKHILAERIANFGKKPRLTIIQVGNEEASNRYVNNKVKDCEEVGIKADVHKYNKEITTMELCEEISRFAKSSDGIMVQLPVPEHICVDTLVSYIPAEKDVDGFRHDSWHDPATPTGIMKYLRACDFPIEGADVVVIGRSDIVGKPMARMLTEANATVTLCHSKTKDLESKLSKADLIICAVGKPGFIKASDWTAPIIDVGINFVDGKLVGDVSGTAHNVTPVPGGVGLLTRYALLENVFESAKNRENQ